MGPGRNISPVKTKLSSGSLRASAQSDFGNEGQEIKDHQRASTPVPPLPTSPKVNHISSNAESLIDLSPHAVRIWMRHNQMVLADRSGVVQGQEDEEDEDIGYIDSFGSEKIPQGTTEENEEDITEQDVPESSFESHSVDSFHYRSKARRKPDGLPGERDDYLLVEAASARDTPAVCPSHCSRDDIEAEITSTASDAKIPSPVIDVSGHESEVEDQRGKVKRTRS